MSRNDSDVTYAVALTTCPAACKICYGEFDTYCTDVVARHLKIAKEMFVQIPKKNFQPGNKRRR